MFSNKTTSNFELEEYARKLKIPNFKICMRNELPASKDNQAIILNLNDSSQTGSHWTALYTDNKNNSYYMDSFGIEPPNEVLNFIGNRTLNFNTLEVQKITEETCGIFALYVLYKLANGEKWQTILFEFLKHSNAI